VRRRLQLLFAYPSTFLACVAWMATGAGLLIGCVYGETVARKWFEIATRPQPVIVKPYPMFCRFPKARTKTAARYEA
jgi:hypothetical protein